MDSRRSNQIRHRTYGFLYLGRSTRALEIPYQHLPAVATAEKKKANREFIVVGWDVDAVAAITGREQVA
jgi:hypothetical protein